MEDLPYFGTYFTDDLDLPLPEGEDWDEYLGETHFLKFYKYYDFFIYVCSNIKSMCLQMLSQRDLPICH